MNYRSYLGIAGAMAVLLAWTAPAKAEETGLLDLKNFSTTLNFTTDYVFRGISQSSRDPAFQPSLDWKHAPTGLYLGAWASNVEFNNDASVEVDIIGGKSGELFWGLGYSAGFIYYVYPNSRAAQDFVEVAGSLTKDFGFAALTANLFYAWDFVGTDDDGTYAQLQAKVPLLWDFAAIGHVATQTIGNEARAGLPDYFDWSAGISRNMGGFDFKLQFLDTDVNRPACSNGTGNCREQFVFSVNRTFNF